MKALWITLGVLFVLLLACCGGVFLVGRNAYKQVMAVNGEATTFAKESLTAIGANWDMGELKKRADTNLASDAAKLKGIVAMGKTELGELKSIGELKFESFNSGTELGKGAQTTVTLTGPATFKKKPAEIRIEVVKRGDKWFVADLMLTPR